MLKERFTLLKNNPNIDFLIAEICGRKNKTYSKPEHKLVLKYLKGIFGKSKKITLSEIFGKRYKIDKVKNNKNYMILNYFDNVVVSK